MNIDKIVSIISKGGIVLIPTDTIYGLICDATNEKSVKKIYDLKGRDYSKPMIVLMSDFNMIKKYTSSINILEEKLISRYLPGELTIILNKNDLIPNIVTSNMSTVGIRIPNNKNLIDIIDKLGKPIVSTSANISSKEVITSIDLLEETIKNNVDYIYDGGYINKEASTIIKVSNNKILILREGTLSKIIRNDYSEYINKDYLPAGFDASKKMME